MLSQLPPSEIDIDLTLELSDPGPSPPPSKDAPRGADGGESDEWMAKMIRPSSAGESSSGSPPSDAPPDEPGPAPHTPQEDPKRPAIKGMYLKVVTKNEEQDTPATTEAARQRMNRALQFQQSDNFDEAVSEYASVLRSDPSPRRRDSG